MLSLHQWIMLNDYRIHRVQWMESQSRSTFSDRTEFSQYDVTVDSERLELIEKFLSHYGLCCLTYDQLGWDGIEIGYILEEGSKEEFNSSLKIF